VLALSKGKTRLLRLTGSRLSEINDGHFPLRYLEQFQFETKTGPIIQYYDDESRINEIRLHAFFRHVKHELEPYLRREDLPIVLMAVNAYSGDFRRVTHLDERIVRSIHGNYDKHSIAELRKVLVEKMRIDTSPRK
jgi:hypothetical protein